MWHFIRGYFDGDGCISASNTTKKVNGKEYYHTNIGFTIISKDKNILENYVAMIEEKEYNSELLGELNVYDEISKQPNRKNCALLPMQAVEKMLNSLK